MAIVYQCKGPKDTWKQFSSLVRTNPVIGRFIGNIYILDERDAPKTAVQSIHPNACSRCFREEADDVCRLSRREIVDWRRKLKKTDPNKDICYFCDHNIAVHPLY